MNRYVMLLTCLDRPGIVNEITGSLLDVNANIVDADQHSTDEKQGAFFIRIEFVLANGEDQLPRIFDELSVELDADIDWFNMQEPLKCSILVSKEDHCLQEVLYQWKSNALNIMIDSIISNHDEYKSLADWYELPFHHVPSGAKHVSEEQIISLTQSTNMLIMARYMQILSLEFLSSYNRPVINIHHSFLPSFVGAKPYHQAFARGVKLIGATAHYATGDLDEGPIIGQKVAPVTHRHSIHDLKRLGQQLEKQCLIESIQAISEHRVIVHENKTIVF